MRVESLSSLLPFNAGELPGVPKSTLDRKLKGLDLSGVIYRQSKQRDGMPATSMPVFNLPGLAPVNAGPAQSQDAQLDAQARQLVSQTFFGTMLKQMRDSPFKSDLFEGGRGGQAFSSLYDQRLVEQMSRGAGKKLVDSIVKRFKQAKGAYAKQPNRDARSSDRGYDALNANAPMSIPADDATKEAANPFRNVKINVHPDLRS